jgi:bifunctional oligoribonuclease and PAP phosphatase NrnA
MKPMDETLLRQVGDKLNSAQSILVICHARPDGDAIGSMLGLGLSLQAAGKKVQMVSVDGVPSSLRHLQGAKKVRNRPKGRSDVVCVVDCSEFIRIGDIFPADFIPDINIDHHITNLNFAGLNLVDPQAVATAQLIADLLPAVGLPFNQSIAEALLTGLITDTIGFRTSNVTPAALRLAARLMEMGANLSELYRCALVNRSFEATSLWGAGLANLEREDRLVWATLTWADRLAVNYPGRDDADLVNVLSAIEDADIAMIFVEQPNGHVKVSWRSQPGFDVSRVALQFAGGGHPAASGADIPGTLDDVRQKVLDATRPLLKRD